MKTDPFQFIPWCGLIVLLSGISLGDQNSRNRLFDADWRFLHGDASGARQSNFDDSSWRQLDIPHDWSIEGPIAATQPSGNDGGYFPTGIGWYRKTFGVPSTWQGKRVHVYFEGVYMNSEVFLNGKPLGFHPYGYSSFDYDLSPYLSVGQENVVAVRVDNSKQKNCRWYSGSGIYRHVWLVVTDPIHIDHWGVAITTPEVSSEKATVQVKTRVKNETSEAQRLVLSTQVVDKRGQVVGQHDVNLEMVANNEKDIAQIIPINDPLLWSPETPNLYQAQIKLVQGNRTVDVTQESFGIRSITFSVDHGFQLNGKAILLNGGCVHHDNGCLGAKAYDRAEERRVELLKSAGFNAVRTSHNPPSEAFLDACDRLGLLVIDEAFDGWREQKTPHDYAQVFDDWWQRDVESMVLRDRNHPSIVCWSIGNEIIERTKPEAVETANRLANCIRHMDPTRPVTSAMTTWGQGWDIFDPLMAAHDICGYNYQLQRAESDHERVPSRIIVNTESYPKNAFFIWDQVQRHSYIIGDFVWTAIDYLGESGIGGYYYPGEKADEHWESSRYPWHGAYCGDIDLTGWRKPISHYRSLLYNDDEKLYMAVREPNPDNGPIKLTGWAVWPTWESWTWPGHEGKDIQVEVVSRYPKVRLYLNDKLIGEQQTTQSQEFKAVFTVPYAPGVLKAVGVEANAESESMILRTAGKPAKIHLVADRTDIWANGQDLSFVTIEITDEDGRLQPNAENSLTFAIEGPGAIVGLDNGNLKDLDPYVAHSRKAWHGRALAVVKSTQSRGDITLTASSPGLSTATVRIKSVGQ